MGLQQPPVWTLRLVRAETNCSCRLSTISGQATDARPRTVCSICRHSFDHAGSRRGCNVASSSVSFEWHTVATWGDAKQAPPSLAVVNFTMITYTRVSCAGLVQVLLAECWHPGGRPSPVHHRGAHLRLHRQVGSSAPQGAGRQRRHQGGLA
jgi:hypothetical protein